LPIGSGCILTTPWGRSAKRQDSCFPSSTAWEFWKHSFYENDSAFLDRPKLTPDPALRDRFQNAITRFETLARANLAKDPKDRDALFGLTLSSGLQADYAARIEKRNLASLHFTKQASASAQQSLAVCHDCYDALLATGFSKYIIGSMAAPVRWILRVGGFPADKQGGITDLQTTAEHGHYLARLLASFLPLRMCARRTGREPWNCLPDCNANFPATHCFPAKSNTCAPLTEFHVPQTALRKSASRSELPFYPTVIHQKFTRL